VWDISVKRNIDKVKSVQGSAIRDMPRTPNFANLRASYPYHSSDQLQILHQISPCSVHHVVLTRQEATNLRNVQILGIGKFIMQ